MSQKRGTIFSLVDRVFLLSHPDFHQKNLELVRETLLNNDYSLSLIFTVMNDKIKNLVNKKTLKQNEIPSKFKESHTSNWFIIPYVSNISEKFNNVVARTKLKLAFHSLNKLSRHIKVHKDSIQNLQKKNVVYKICCKD